MSATAVASKPPQRRVEVLDLLRLFAVAAVLLFHFGFRGAIADGYTDVSLPGLVPVIKYGYLGVQLFFIISGFVIAYSAEGRSATEFAVARVSRIYPGFLLCMTITFIVTLAIGAPRIEASVTQWLANFVILSPALKQPFMDGAYWSIVYEITFYAWVFLLLLIGKFRREIECHRHRLDRHLHFQRDGAAFRRGTATVHHRPECVLLRRSRALRDLPRPA